ncbi:MAG: hypothetical protein K2R98_29020 [Gemmataceae bacterium]|nr:hypothetical protein [Gemmataceae bacterium]
MNAVDTNVLIYRLDQGEPAKRLQAIHLIDQLLADPTPTLLLWQVLGELLRCLQTWREQARIPHSGPTIYLQATLRLFPLKLPNQQVFDRALDLADRYSLSHWDSMLLGACIEAKVDTLFTEDMGAPRQIDSVQLVNPFI